VIDFLELVVPIEDGGELALSRAVAATDAAEVVVGKLLAEVVGLLGDALLHARTSGCARVMVLMTFFLRKLQ
jgi:hypothetical protein